MPIYVFNCNVCGETFELLREVSQYADTAFCPKCHHIAYRAMGKELPVMRPDMQARYDISLGKYIGSRRELREELAFQGAYNPDLMQNDTPMDGRLTSEERAELEGRKPSTGGTIFDKRKRPGWGENPPPDSDGITVEGEANYAEITDYIKDRSGYDRRTLRPKRA